jgi:hypothetical protein
MYKEKVGTNKECIHCPYNLRGVLPLSSPSQTGTPSIEDLVEGAIDGEGEGALEEHAFAWPGDQGRGELLQQSLKVASAKS